MPRKHLILAIYFDLKDLKEYIDTTYTQGASSFLVVSKTKSTWTDISYVSRGKECLNELITLESESSSSQVQRITRLCKHG